MQPTRHPLARFSTIAGLVVAIVTTGSLVWKASYAAFSATTTNPGNSWSTGSVTITDDRSGAAVFSVATVEPDGASSTLNPPGTGAFTASSAAAGGSACIKVTYTGTTPADIRMYGTLTNTGGDGGLGQFLLFDVDTGTDSAGGSDPSCATYTSSTYRYGSASNTNVYLNGIPTGYVGGLAGWTGATQNTSRWYRLSWLMPATVSAASQGEQVQATFVWEAQSS
ncbi:MAG TPA: hypothetical protein VF657_12635 [Actinoplanes sp.]|jgi:hypothetical protein